MPAYLETYRGARVLVLGAAGFIGRWVSRLLTQAEAELFLASRDSARAEQVFSAYHVSGQVCQVDLTDFEQMERLIFDVCPAITFNLAGYGVDPAERDPYLADRLNAELPAALCQALSRHREFSWKGQAIVHAGTAAEYGRAKGDLSEQTSPEPSTQYGTSKLAGTLLLKEGCQKLNLPGLTARLFTVYGPGEHQGRLLPTLLAAAEKDSPLPLTSGYQRRDFTYVSDVAEGLLRLGSSVPKPGDWVNLATGKLTPVREFVEIASREYGISPDRLRFGELPVRKEEMDHEPINLHKLREWINWVPGVDVHQGIRANREFLSKMGRGETMYAIRKSN